MVCALPSKLYTVRSFRNRQRVDVQSSSGPDICDFHLFEQRAMLIGWNACCNQRSGRWTLYESAGLGAPRATAIWVNEGDAGWR